MIVEATTDGKRVYARIPFDYGGNGPDYAKRIAGASWRKTAKDWSYPLSLDTCYALRGVFGENLKVRQPLGDWARSELARRSNMENIRNGAVSADIRRVLQLAPKLYAALADRKYQITGASFISEGRHVLLGDQPGLGKTLQAIAALIQSEARDILVACPRTATRTVWEREVARWSPRISTFVAQGSRAQREAAMEAFARDEATTDDPRMLIINTEMIRMVPEICPDGKLKDCAHTDDEKKVQHRYDIAEYQWLHDRSWDAIVLDESHNSLASTFNIQSKNITQVRYGAVQLRRRLSPDGIALAMSGTPFRSKLTKSWGTLNWLDPKAFSSYWRFAEKHFGVHNERIVGRGGRIMEVTRLGANGQVLEMRQLTKEEKENEKAPEPIDMAAFQAELAPYYLARTKQEAAPDLPPITYAGQPPSAQPSGQNAIWLDMDGKQAKAYEEMRKLAKARLEEGSVTAIGVLAELTRLRQFACSFATMADDLVQPYNPSNKLDWLVEFLLEREGNEGKVVVASTFTKLIELAANVVGKELGQPVLTLTGKTTDRARAQLVQDFNDPDHPARVAIINTHAGGEAITLDKCADDLVFLDLPWTSDAAEQVEARIHRVSRIHNVVVYRLLTTGTVDEWMANLTDEQRRVLMSAKPAAIDLALEALK